MRWCVMWWTLAAPDAVMLAAYACDPALSRGRRHPQASDPGRTEFQRDRDRIVHCSAFRRLVYKTQVFLNHEGDLFRTRLTHSLEVAQLSRSMARALGLNEDLVEAIALAHDLGHTPFGHAGQDVLNECMANDGGFEHNLQSLRVVDLLEERYLEFDGLNLSFETREGILKHCSRANAQELEAAQPLGVGLRFLNKTQPSLEAQLCNLADAIAYNAHDIDDGVRSGLLVMEQLQEVPLFEKFRQQTLARHASMAPTAMGRRLLYEALRRMLSAQVYDLVEATSQALRQVKAAHVDAVRAMPPMVRFSESMHAESTTLKRFLFQNLYRHPQVTKTTSSARDVVQDLFRIYLSKPHEMAGNLSGRGTGSAQTGLPRVVADYIAGMTDRFALREHERLTGLKVLQ